MIILTFDVDWAPPFVVHFVLDKLRELGLRATIFCTSPLKIEDEHNFELAIHPNFMPDSTQGSSEDDVLNVMQAWFPHACGIRTHRLYWHSGLIHKLQRRGFLYDSSILLPFHPHIQPVKTEMIVRFPIWWTDNLHLTSGLILDKIDLPGLQSPGMKIFNFHPIHIYLNTNHLAIYKKNKKLIHPLETQTATTLLKYRQDGIGLNTFFDSILKHLCENRCQTYCLRDLVGGLSGFSCRI